MFKKLRKASKRVQAWLSQYDWAAIIGSVLVLLFLLGVLTPLAHYDGDQQLQAKAYEWVWGWLTSAAFWTAAFTGILTLSTYLLWRETERLAEGGERQNAIINRAFVFHKQYAFIDIHDTNGTVVARDVVHTWENSGNTPAVRVTSHISWQSLLAVLPDNFSYPDLGDRDAAPDKMIGPKASIYSDPIRIRQDILNAVAEESVHLFMWGWTEYNDAFDPNVRHRTEFCFKIWASVHPDGKQATIGFRHWGVHNGYDETCLKPVHT
jgi:hypothetical protein